MKVQPKQSQSHSVTKLLIIAFILGAFLFALQLKRQKSQSDLDTLQLKTQENYQKDGIKFLSKNIVNLSLSNFDLRALYELNPDNGRISIYSDASNFVKDPNSIPESRRLNSFIINARIDNNEINYISACLPRHSVLSWQKQTYQSLLHNEVWPFVSEYNGKIEVNCCPKDEPQCRYNRVIDQNSKYIVQIFRYDPMMSILKPILTKAELGSVSSAGFFLVANKHYKNKFQARFFTLYNECLSQKIVHGKSHSFCNKKISFTSNQLDGSFKGHIFSDQNLLDQSIGQ